eukprot:scaffold32301_cov135-Isochrysis_galbana.AAC.1
MLVRVSCPFAIRSWKRLSILGLLVGPVKSWIGQPLQLGTEGRVHHGGHKWPHRFRRGGEVERGEELDVLGHQQRLALQRAVRLVSRLSRVLGAPAQLDRESLHLARARVDNEVLVRDREAAVRLALAGLADDTQGVGGVAARIGRHGAVGVHHRLAPGGIGYFTYKSPIGAFDRERPPLRYHLTEHGLGAAGAAELGRRDGGAGVGETGRLLVVAVLASTAPLPKEQLTHPPACRRSGPMGSGGGALPPRPGDRGKHVSCPRKARPEPFRCRSSPTGGWQAQASGEEASNKQN